MRWALARRRGTAAAPPPRPSRRARWHQRRAVGGLHQPRCRGTGSPQGRRTARRRRRRRDRAAAEREQLSYLGFLSELVLAECDDRTRRRAERRIRDAGFPRPKRLEEFSFDANPAINPAVIRQLASRLRLGQGRTPVVLDRLRHRQNPLCRPADYADIAAEVLALQGDRAGEVGINPRFVIGFSWGFVLERSRS